MQTRTAGSRTMGSTASAKGRSKPVRLIHHIAQWPAIVEAAAIVEEYFGATVVQVRPDGGHMGRDEHARRIPERMIRGQGLALENVQAGPGQLPGAQRGVEIRELHGS